MVFNSVLLILVTTFGLTKSGFKSWYLNSSKSYKIKKKPKKKNE